MAPATDRAALIVSHGQPSDPGPQARATEALAARVGAALPGWQVLGATLAEPGALERAVATLGTAALVHPHFMADGWFVSTELPRRLAAAGAEGAQVLAPFGLNADLPNLCAERAVAAARTAGFASRETTLLLTAHGSPSDPRPARAARAILEAVAARGVFRALRIGFVDEAPAIAEAARFDGPGVCLPLFAARAGHVLSDLPAALDMAGFRGAVLAPIGADKAAPALIARSFEACAGARAA